MPEVFLGGSRPPIPRDGHRCGMCGHVGVDVLFTPYFLVQEGENEGIWVCPQCIGQYQLRECTHCNTHKMSTYRRSAIERAMWDGLDGVCSACEEDYKSTIAPNRVSQCDRCGNVHLDADEPLCYRCRDNHTKCTKCGEQWVQKDRAHSIDLVINEKGDLSNIKLDPMCKPCRDKIYRVCHECSNPYAVGTSPADHYCARCASKMQVCGVCGTLSSGVKEYCGHHACRRCRDQRFRECDECHTTKLDCGQRYHDQWHREHGREMKCLDCIGAPIMHWNYKRNPTFYGKDTLFFGLENEYDWISDIDWQGQTDLLRHWVRDRAHMFHLVHDGSLRLGVELVSQPATFEFWMSQQELLPANTVNNLELGTQGCHIHMNKDAFKPFHLFKFLNFMTQQFENLLPIYGRGIGSYREDIGTSLAHYAKVKDNQRKYWWVNMRSTNTVEFRVFVAAADSITMKSYIQLLHSVYYYTKDRSPTELQDWTKYFKHIRKEKQYCELVEALEKKPKPNGCVLPDLVEALKPRKKSVGEQGFLETPSYIVPRPRLSSTRYIQQQSRTQTPQMGRRGSTSQQAPRAGELRRIIEEHTTRMEALMDNRREEIE